MRHVFYVLSRGDKIDWLYELAKWVTGEMGWGKMDELESMSVPRSDSALAADIVATSTLLGDSKTPALVKPPQKKCAFQMSALEDDSFEIDDAFAADIVETSTLPGVSRTPALVENNKQMFSEVVKVLSRLSPKNLKSLYLLRKLMLDLVFGGSVSEHGLGFKLPASPPLTTNTQNNLLMDNVVPEKDSNSFPLFGTSAERVSLFAFSANGPSDSKPSAS
nr:hypothetical protein [Tanacetum cinerariifolium]